MLGSHLIPRNHTEKYFFIGSVVTYLADNAERFGMGKETPIGKWYADIFLGEYGRYEEAFAAWFEPTTQTHAAGIRLNDEEKRITPIFRDLCNMLRFIPLVENADLVAMNLPLKPTYQHHQRSPIADNMPSFDILPIEGHRLRIFFYPGHSSAHVAKPRGQHGAEIRWILAEEPVKDVEELTQSSFHTASPCTLNFGVNDHGKRIQIALRWENNRGQKGPWSAIAINYIP
ncbi:MAG: hypothetical protein LBI58_04775 [Tannerellaceae bacterium]|jgi:hypothetical protein|nr:hypothetical protein [Tannerellaceae bacterium]